MRLFMIISHVKIITFQTIIIHCLWIFYIARKGSEIKLQLPSMVETYPNCLKLTNYIALISYIYNTNRQPSYYRKQYLRTIEYDRNTLLLTIVNLVFKMYNIQSRCIIGRNRGTKWNCSCNAC